MAEQRRRFSCWRVLGCLLVVLGLPASAVIWSMVDEALWFRRHDPRAVSCQSNLRQLELAAQAYATDHDGCLPLGPQWAPPLRDILDNDQDFICPSDPHDGPLSYGMNMRLFGARISDHAPETVLFHDGWNGTVVERHRGGANYVFLSGEARTSLKAPPEDLLVVVLERDPR